MANYNRRIDLDIAKGIGIILVVWAHANAPLSNYITQFHMPLFFYISGILFNPEKSDIKGYVKNKSKNLLFPFWGWNLIFLPLFFLLFYWRKWTLDVFIQSFLEILLTVNKVPFLGAMWFVASLFWVSIIYKIIYTIFEKNKNRYIIIFIIYSLIAAIGFKVTLPYKLSRTLIFSLFYALGHLSQCVNINKQLTHKGKYIMSIFAILLYILIASYNECHIAENIYKYKFLFIIGALAAIYFVLNFSKLLSYKLHPLIKNQLIYFGQNSISIVIWHFLTFRFAIILQILLLKAPLNAIVAFPIYSIESGWWLIYVLFGIYGSLLVDYILHNNFMTHILKKVYLIR